MKPMVLVTSSGATVYRIEVDEARRVDVFMTEDGLTYPVLNGGYWDGRHVRGLEIDKDSRSAIEFAILEEEWGLN